MALRKETRDALRRERTRPVGMQHSLLAAGDITLPENASELDWQWMYRDASQHLRNTQNPLNRRLPCRP